MNAHPSTQELIDRKSDVSRSKPLWMTLPSDGIRDALSQLMTTLETLRPYEAKKSDEVEQIKNELNTEIKQLEEALH